MSTKTELEILSDIASAIGRPGLSVKKLNVLYALRNSWASKRTLNAREVALLQQTIEGTRSLWEEEQLAKRPAETPVAPPPPPPPVQKGVQRGGK